MESGYKRVAWIRGNDTNVTLYCRQVLTGSYHNYFRIYDTDDVGANSTVLQADKSAFKAKKIGGTKGGAKGQGAGQNKKDGMQTENIDFAKKILHGSWHPKENTIAIAATNNLFLYSTLG